MKEQPAGLRENEVRLTAVPMSYLAAVRGAMILMAIAMVIVVVGTVVTFSTVQTALEESRAALSEHRHTSSEHICYAGLDHLNTDLHLRAALEEAGLQAAAQRIPTKLRPEVQNICDRLSD
jgi:hypothetical protein